MVTDDGDRLRRNRRDRLVDMVGGHDPNSDFRRFGCDLRDSEPSCGNH